MDSISETIEFLAREKMLKLKDFFFFWIQMIFFAGLEGDCF